MKVDIAWKNEPVDSSAYTLAKKLVSIEALSVASLI
jgi:hypothetical protein